MKTLIIFLIIATSNNYANDIATLMRNNYFDLFFAQDALSIGNCKRSKMALNSLKRKSHKLQKITSQLSEAHKLKFKTYNFYLNDIINNCNNSKTSYRYLSNQYRNLLQSCTGCHQMDHLKNAPTSELVFGDTEVQKIHHLIVSRQYPVAKSRIDKFFKKPKIEEYKNISSLEQDLFLKYAQKPALLLRRYEKRHPPKIYRQSLKTWKKSLFNLQEPKNKVALFSLLDKLIANRTGISANDDEIIPLKFYFGKLFDHLQNASSKDDIAKYYYYLGSLENRISHEIYATNNIYLTDCVLNYPKSKFAKKCFNEIRDQIELSYSGSRGTDIPEESIDLIIKLNSKLGKNKNTWIKKQGE